MTLDGHTRNTEALDTVGINRTLGQPFGVGYLLGLGIEHFHEVTTYNLTLLFRVGNTFEVLKELLAGVHSYHVQAQSLISLHNFGKLILAQHAMIHEDTSEIFTDGTVQQRSTYGRIHTS